VGELSLKDLRERLAKLPRPVRIFGLGVGDNADMGLLAGLSRGAFAERIGDANGAARTALRLYEYAERPVWLGAKVDLGSAVERIVPRDLGAQVADETLFVIGRMASSGRLSQVTLSGPGGDVTRSLTITRVEDNGDLRQRWAEARLYQMMDEATGRAAMVDLGVRHAIITPVTSLYVPTTNEMTPDERAELEQHKVDEQRTRLDAWNVRVRSLEEDEEEKATEVVTASNADNKEGGTGTRAKGEEGSMGNPNTRATGSRFGVMGPSRDEPSSATKEYAPQGGKNDKSGEATAASPAPPPAAKPGDGRAAAGQAQAQAPAPERVAADRANAARDASEFGMIGLLNSGAGGDPKAPINPWAQGAAASASPTATAAPTPGATDALSARGNMWGDDIGQAFGSGGLGLSGIGAGGGGRGEASKGTSVTSTLKGKLGGEANQLDWGANKSADQEKGWSRDSSVKGGDLDGFDDDGVARRPDIAIVSHVLSFRCSPAASLPLDERAILWRERLAGTLGQPAQVAAVYARALMACEAPALRDRSRLLQLMLDVTTQVDRRVQLWRMFMTRPEGDTLYRGMLARVRTPDEMRNLHRALGLRSIDTTTLAKLMNGAKTPADRAAKLRVLVREWPDDFALALLLLDALEDADDAEGARDLGKKLRARPDADARLRTAVGELFLRLAARGKSPEEKAADTAEARRAFGEIVEFAPDDPVARRRLGDLLRAHGWYEDAARQYETLAKLTPDDPAVYLLLASAAEGVGKLEEAVRWAEKAGASGAPDMPQSAAQTARALAVTYLAWERDAARTAGRKDDVEALAVRAARLLAGARALDSKSQGTRATLVWSHPELHPTLWSNALGAVMPAQEQDVTAGVAHVVVPRRDDAFVEVRIDPEDAEHAARLGATATLTVILHEGEEGERIKRFAVKLGPGAAATQRFRITADEVTP